MNTTLHDEPMTHSEDNTHLQPPVRRAAIWGPLFAVTLIAALLIAGIWRRVNAQKNLREDAAAMQLVAVNVSTVKRNSKPQELILPGNVQAFQATTIFARTSGYLSRWLVDIGDKVTAGQLLAEIETPEVDLQLEQARGQLKQAEANQQISKITADRWKVLADKKVVSSEENDTNQATYRANDANLAAARANVDRLVKLQAFEKVTAPFPGTITARSVDVGALVSAGSGTAGTALFSIAQTDPLRVFINVPQTNAPSIQDGLTAKAIAQEYPGREFEGKVVRTSGSLDPQSRTLLTEVDLPNKDGALYAGMYVQVKFILQDKTAPIIVPANAYLFRAEGPQVAVVTKDHRIQWRNVQIGRDFGTDIEVLSGLDEGDEVVNNPTDDLLDGLKVQPQELK